MALSDRDLIHKLFVALLLARSTVYMVHTEFNRGRFTDRYGDGELATKRLGVIDETLKDVKEWEEENEQN